MDVLRPDLFRHENTTRSVIHLWEQLPPLLAKTRKLLENCNKGLHSWFGRCNLLKMSILPKFLYLFQALPIKTPPIYFKQVQALFTRFVWAHKKPRIPRSQLSTPKHYGGLALPDVRKYYQATHLGRVLDWSHHRDSQLWAQIEQHQTIIPLWSAIWCSDSLPAELKSHPIIGNTKTVHSSYLTHLSNYQNITFNPNSR